MSLEQNKAGNGGSDPTMEEILSSIRRIIAEDNEPKPDAKPVVTEGTPPEPEPLPEPEPEPPAPKVKRNVLELTEMVADDGSVVSLPGRAEPFDDEEDEMAAAPAEGDEDIDPFSDAAFAHIGAAPETSAEPEAEDDDPFGDFPKVEQPSEPAADDDFGSFDVDDGFAKIEDDGFAKIDEDSLPAMDGDDDFPQAEADDDFFRSDREEEPPPRKAEPRPEPVSAKAEDAADDFSFNGPLAAEDDFGSTEDLSFSSFEIGDIDMAATADEPEPEPEALFAAEPLPIADEPVLDEPDFATPEPVLPVSPPPVAQPAAVQPAASRQEVMSDMTRDQLISEPAAALTRNAFNQVAQAMQAEQMARSFATNSRTIEQMAEELLAPLLKEWLDANLAGMVEKLVSEEIARIAGRPNPV